MTDSDIESEIEKGLIEIDTAIISNVLKFLKTGEFSNKTAGAYIVAYTVVYKLADDEYESSTKLFDYYNKTLISYMKDQCSLLKQENENTLLDAFLNESEKTKILIHWMRKVFAYLDKFFTKNAKTGTLFENSLKNFYQHLFQPLRPKLISALNNLINRHRDGEVVEIMKIVRIIKIFRQVDLKDVVLNKVEESYEWTGNSNKSNKGVLSEWFYNSFLGSTEAYIFTKSKKEISSLSAPEYIKSCLKYLKEEEERKNMFISRDFHNSLDVLNNKFLIEENSKILASVIF